MRRLLTFATLFASLLPLPSAAAEVSTQDGLESAWGTGGNIELTNNITITNTGSSWTSTASSITLTGKTGAEQLSLKEPGLGQADYAQMIASDVTIEKLSLKNDDDVYLLQATSVTLNNVTIASSSESSAGAVVDVTTKLTLSGTLTLGLNSPCDTLLSCYSADLTGLSGITINIGNDFSLGDGGATNLILFTGTAPSTVGDLKCTVNGPSGYYVVLQKNMPGGTVLRLVPEPGSATLTLIGLLALLHRRRRTRSKGIHGEAFVRG